MYIGCTYKTKLPHKAKPTPNHDSFDGDGANNIWDPRTEYKDGTQKNQEKWKEQVAANFSSNQRTRNEKD